MNRRSVRRDQRAVEDPLLTIDDLAVLLNKSPAAIYQMRWLGRGPVALKIGNSLRFHRTDVETWLASLREPR
jgi:predicted DNA-binding transcriptional regulator AlpA